MDDKNRYPEHACQHCGSIKKLVETLIDDEFVWNDGNGRFEPNEFSNEFEHTGEERCADCNLEWTGIRETAGGTSFTD